MSRSPLWPRGGSIVTAVLLAAGLLLGTTWLAGMVRASNLYSKSRIISMIVSQKEVDITDLAGNQRKVDLMLKFVGALTEAYINFEMIPVNEVGTFAAVFESIPQEVEVDRFEYHRKNLTISGSAADEAEYRQFLTALRNANYFEGVAGHFYLDTAGRISFEMECISRSIPVHLEF